MSLAVTDKTVFTVSHEPMTDEQIHAAAADEWLSVLMTLWDAVGKQVDEKRLTVYARQLSIIPLALLEKAVARAIRNNGQYQTVPTIGAVWDAVRRELDQPNMTIEDAIDNWMEDSWSRCTYYFKAGKA